MAKGTRKVLINPSTNKSGDSFEALLPENILLKNVTITPSGNLTRRFGFELAYSTGELSPIVLMINYGPGYAVTENGFIYRLDTLTKLTVKLLGITGDNEYRPQFVIHKDMVIIVDGGFPVKIQDGDSSVLGGNPPQAKFVCRLGSYTVMSGYTDAEEELTEFKWCSAENPENWETGDSGFASIRKDSASGVKAMASNGSYLYFFKDVNSEVWALTGGIVMFQRHDAACFDVGITAPYSLVKSINSLVWLGHTNDFYELAGGEPKIISTKYKQALDELVFFEAVFGYDFPKEYKLRWFAQAEGKCFVYDYLNKVWSEDGIGDGNDFQRMPFNSQMYLNNVCYMGSSVDDGKIYRYAKNIMTDAGAAILVVRQFRVTPFENGDTRGTLDRVTFRIKRGVATAAETTPQLWVQVRADFGEWHNFYIDLGIPSDQNPNKEIYPRLYGTEFEFKLIESDAVEYLVTDMQIFYQGNP